jgi:hypothetical protein
MSAEPIFMELTYVVIKELPYLRAGFLLTSTDGTRILEAYDSDNDNTIEKKESATYVSTCRIPGNILNSGVFIVGLNFGMPGIKNLANLPNATSFRVENSNVGTTRMNMARSGILNPTLEWTKESTTNAPD